MVGDNCKLLEIRSSLKDVADPKTGEIKMDKKAYLRAMVAGIEEFKTNDQTKQAATGILIGILPAINRRKMSDAPEIIKIAADPEFKKYVRGIDLSGDPSYGDINEIVNLCQEARSKYNLKLGMVYQEVFLMSTID